VAALAGARAAARPRRRARGRGPADPAPLVSGEEPRQDAVAGGRGVPLLRARARAVAAAGAAAARGPRRTVTAGGGTLDADEPRRRTMTPDLTDELQIRRMVERWALWRDAGDWERFATVWHPDGVMMATWFQGPYTEFIRVTQEGWAKGVSILH